MKKPIITEDVVAAFSVCPRKSFQLMFLNITGNEQPYATYLRKRKRVNKELYFKVENFLQFPADDFTGKASFIIDATIKTDNLVVKNIHLKKSETKSSLGNYSYEPLIFSSSSNVTIEDRVRIPVYIDNVITSLQIINPNGDKWFVKNGRIKGGYYPIGKVKNVLYLCEGFATGATIHHETKEAVAVCFNAGNLKPVAVILKKKHPNIQFIIAADNDYRKKSNVGLIKGREAAATINAKLIYPDFSEFGNPESVSDFNEYVDLGVIVEFGV